MHMNSEYIVERVQKHATLKGADTPFGVVSGFGMGPTNARVRKDANGAHQLTLIVNTGDIDLQDEVVIPSGCTDMAYLMSNQKVFADHIYDIEHTIGALRSPPKPYPSKADHLAWKASIVLDTGNPIAKAVVRIVENLGGIGASIGFIPIDRGAPTEDELGVYAKAGQTLTSIVRTWKWFEFSLTCLPCNVTCQTQDVSGESAKMVEGVERLVTMGSVDRAAAAALGVPGVTAKRKAHAVPSRIVHAGGFVTIKGCA